MEELLAVTDAVKHVGSSWLWLGGKYNSTSGKYYWVGSGVKADVAAMYDSYPPAGNAQHNLALQRPRPKLFVGATSFASLCEEY